MTATTITADDKAENSKMPETSNTTITTIKSNPEQQEKKQLLDDSFHLEYNEEKPILHSNNEKQFDQNKNKEATKTNEKVKRDPSQSWIGKKVKSNQETSIEMKKENKDNNKEDKEKYNKESEHTDIHKGTVTTNTVDSKEKKPKNNSGGKIELKQEDRIESQEKQAKVTEDTKSLEKPSQISEKTSEVPSKANKNTKVPQKTSIQKEMLKSEAKDKMEVTATENPTTIPKVVEKPIDARVPTSKQQHKESLKRKINTEEEPTKLNQKKAKLESSVPSAFWTHKLTEEKNNASTDTSIPVTEEPNIEKKSYS